jgi:hypothetical protein
MLEELAEAARPERREVRAGGMWRDQKRSRTARLTGRMAQTESKRSPNRACDRRSVFFSLVRKGDDHDADGPAYGCMRECVCANMPCRLRRYDARWSGRDAHGSLAHLRDDARKARGKRW